MGNWQKKLHWRNRDGFDNNDPFGSKMWLGLCVCVFLEISWTAKSNFQAKKAKKWQIIIWKLLESKANINWERKREIWKRLGERKRNRENENERERGEEKREKKC